MKRIGYYKSCSLNASSNDYARSLEMCFSKLGTRLVPIDDWNCCGASSAHSTSELLGLALPARNLALAEQQGLTTLLVPCSACYTRMLTAADKIRRNDDLAAEINEVIAPLRYMGTVQVKNILEILWTEVGADEILRAKEHDLGGMKVVCYYGCYLTRTPGVDSFDNRENPQSMERLLRLIGAKPLDWPLKTDCCGAGFSLIEAPVSVQLSEKMIDMAHNLGAEAIVTTCPLCQTNLDVNQDRLRSEKAAPYDMPVFYISDLVGVAAGSELGNRQWRKRFVDPRELLNRYALA
jgi:heterodisulfide reductase subunit B